MTDLIPCRCQSCSWTGSLHPTDDAVCPNCGDAAERTDNLRVSKKKNKDLGEWLTPAQVAEVKGCSRWAVYKAITEGRLRSRTIGGRPVCHRVTVDAWTPQQGPGRPRLKKAES